MSKKTLTMDEQTRKKPGAKPGKDWQEKYKNRKKRPNQYTIAKSFKTTPEGDKNIKYCAKQLGVSESNFLRLVSAIPLEKIKKLL